MEATKKNDVKAICGDVECRFDGNDITLRKTRKEVVSYLAHRYVLV
jgi:hypothetical protein